MIRSAADSLRRRIPAERPPRDEGSPENETVLALHVGGVLPLGKFVNGSFHQAGPRRKELLAVHDRFVVYPERGQPRLISVDSVGSVGAAYARGQLAGHGRVTRTLELSREDARLEGFGRGPLAFSVAPDSTVDLWTRIPASDTTLTASQRKVIAEHVARRLAEENEADQQDQEEGGDASDWRDLARRASELLAPSLESSKTLNLAVTSGDFDGDGSTEYLVLAERSLEKVVATLPEADSSESGRFRIRCVPDPGGGHIEDARADSLALVCVKDQTQAAAFAGRIVEDRWKETFSYVESRYSDSYGVSLQALDVNGDGVPELLFSGGVEGGTTYRVFSYEDGTFQYLAGFSHGV